MSLTSFIKIPDVREKFRETFPLPDVKLKGKLKAPPVTNHYALIGTAFDYLLRFYVERLNSPIAETRGWVAEISLEGLKGNLKRSPQQVYPWIVKVKGIIKESKDEYEKYQNTENVTDELLRCCIRLSKVDAIYRGAYLDPKLEEVDERDLKDLRRLLEIVDPEKFKAREVCLLNPLFGEASELVGGADADLVLDHTLIDMKTTKYLKLKGDNVHQIIGYYLLSRIGKLDGVPDDWPINSIALYFSRHGKFVSFDVPSPESNHFPISEEALEEFTSWFQSRAEEELDKV